MLARIKSNGKAIALLPFSQYRMIALNSQEIRASNVDSLLHTLC